MKLNFIITTTILTLIFSACGTQTPQATPEPATATQTLPTSTETQVPATDIAVATETTVPATEAPVVSTGVSFANDVAPIFAASCNKCHGIEQVKEGLDMTSYDTLIAGSFNGTVITPGNSDDSYLVHQIVEGEMPNRGPKLADEQIQLIIDWINQGALNN